MSFHKQRWHNASMSVQITIRNVPDDVRDELAARAARSGKSMQEYLRGELEALARRPSLLEWLDRVRERKAAARTEIGEENIVDVIRASRR